MPTKTEVLQLSSIAGARETCHRTSRVAALPLQPSGKEEVEGELQRWLMCRQSPRMPGCIRLQPSTCSQAHANGCVCICDSLTTGHNVSSTHSLITWHQTTLSNPFLQCLHPAECCAMSFSNPAFVAARFGASHFFEIQLLKFLHGNAPLLEKKVQTSACF
jgi:hypothetical protein